VFDGVTSDMRIAQEEVFGPVLAVQTFSDEEEAIAIANDVSFGLAAGVWTSDLGRAHRVAEAIKAGTVWVNTYGELDSPVSFGGFKSSGIGRELGPHAVEAYTQPKSIWVNTK
jgi:acyl-CoA reductase-like NAD-dependent aldehyde dehydrogenase